VRVAFTTLGCRLNQFETDALEQVTRDAGHAVVAFGADADVVVVNSCTITHDADADTRQLVRRAARGGARVVVTGCMASGGSRGARGDAGGRADPRQPREGAVRRAGPRDR
jgi:threonylcarbamoyladenosine tRNA methylthiotransferase MtaB